MDSALKRTRGAGITLSPAEELEARILIDSMTEPDGDCLIWKGTKNGDGYGQVRIHSKPVLPHRLAYALAHGGLPDKTTVKRSCRRPDCVAVAHLSIRHQVPFDPSLPSCAEPGCSDNARARGFCAAHYSTNRKAGLLEASVIENPERIIPRGERTEATTSKPAPWSPDIPKRAVAAVARHGLSLEDYEQMMEDQEGTCAICDGVNPSGRRLVIDHDHTCCPGPNSCGNCVRGLLCNGCNVFMGSGRDELERLRRCVAYLEAYVGGKALTVQGTSAT